jgi:phenylacetate-CoA ligase
VSGPGTDVSAEPDIADTGAHAGAMAETIARARRQVPFYAQHHRGTTSLALADQPTCTKADLAGYGPLPLSAVPLSAMHHTSATSGTTGSRLFVGYTEADWAEVRAQYRRHHVAALGLDGDDVLLNTHGGGLWIGHPSLQELAHAAGAGTVPVGPSNPQQVLEWLCQLPVTLLSATPSFMRVLVECAEAEGVELSDVPLRMGLLGGEGASPQVRRQVVDAFGPAFRWQELYGSTETAGPILAFGDSEDRLSGCLEVNTAYFVVEILRLDADEPVEPGELGEITVSTPFRHGSTLVWYRTRDLAAQLPGQRGARSGLPTMTSLLGRVDDAIKVRGTLVYPRIVEEVCVTALAPGSEWRIVLTRQTGAHDVMAVQLETDDAGTLDEVADRIHDATRVRPVVTAVPPGSLERFSGKAKRVVDDRPA